ncbi:VPLPA-CTERM sorting domain-containing protein [Pseudomonadota bacterium]
MNTKLLRLISAAALLFSSGGVAMAATVGFSPGTSNVILGGGAFTVDIVGSDFTELAGGTIDLGFDSSILQIDSVSIDPYFDFLPDGGGPAAGNIWPDIGFDTFVNDPATGTFTIATINLTALAGGISSLEILGTSSFFEPTIEIFPTLIAGTVNVSAVPVPAAVWLFGSGLLGLVGMARRKKAA